MRIVIAAVGRLKQGPERELAAEYRKRAEKVGRAFGLRDIEIVEIRESRAADAERRKVEESIGQATPVDEANSRLEVTFLPEGLRWIPFAKGDYWVLKVDPDYRVALVGSPNRHFLWLLARQPQLDAATREAFLAEATRQGFDLSALINTPHTGAPTA